MSITRIFIYGDIHAPYHDKKVVSCMLKCMSRFKPDIVVDLGDFWDCYAVSSFKKDPRRKKRLVDEIEEGLPVLNIFTAAAGKADLISIDGNHEDRLERLLQTPAVEALHGAVSIDTLAPRDNWKRVSYENYVQLGKVIYTHDLGYAGTNATRQSVQAAAHSVVIGHTHRMASTVEGDIRGKHRVCHSFGWGGDVKKADYLHKAKMARDWCHGFGLGHMAPDGTTWFSGVPIIGGKALVDGKVIEG